MILLLWYYDGILYTHETRYSWRYSSDAIRLGYDLFDFYRCGKDIISYIISRTQYKRHVSNITVSHKVWINRHFLPSIKYYHCTFLTCIRFIMVTAGKCHYIRLSEFSGVIYFRPRKQRLDKTRYYDKYFCMYKCQNVLLFKYFIRSLYDALKLKN